MWHFCRWLGNLFAPGCHPHSSEELSRHYLPFLLSVPFLFVCFFNCNPLDFKKEKPLCVSSVCLFSSVINYLFRVLHRLPHQQLCNSGRFSQVEIPSLIALRGMSYGFALAVWGGRRSPEAFLALPSCRHRAGCAMHCLEGGHNSNYHISDSLAREMGINSG